MTAEVEALDVAKSIKSNKTDVSLLSSEIDGVGRDRFTFNFSGGCIHNHQLSDEWILAGFGDGWFALERVE